MRHTEEELTGILKGAGVNFTASLPCEKIKGLLVMLAEEFPHIPLTREEEGVGICAGAALAGRRPAIFLQSSGIGNMINALLSLTGFYGLPLAIFVSQRGIYKEAIEAQFPMGRGLPRILRGAGISHSLVHDRHALRRVPKKLAEVYDRGMIHAFLLSPAIFEGSCRLEPPAATCPVAVPWTASPVARPRLTRYGMLEAAAPYLKDKAVVCNLGFPSKELYHLAHQPSNFYMLGSMGMATPIGLGVSLASEREVVVVDGDGSLLMNPGTLATAAAYGGPNLTILAVDNGAYGSTGSQPTLTGSCVDLELVARGFGMRDTVRAATKKDLLAALRKPRQSTRFIHAVAVAGNRDLPPIAIGHMKIRDGFREFLRRK